MTEDGRWTLPEEEEEEEEEKIPLALNIISTKYLHT
jgi:hypothetical protein